MRQFLLTNLKETPDRSHLRFRVNLEAIGSCLPQLSEFPLYSSKATFTKPTLFIRGTKAQYITEKSKADIYKFFPNAKIIDIDAGHWYVFLLLLFLLLLKKMKLTNDRLMPSLYRVHAEKPEIFVEQVSHFLP